MKLREIAAFTCDGEAKFQFIALARQNEDQVFVEA